MPKKWILKNCQIHNGENVHWCLVFNSFFCVPSMRLAQKAQQTNWDEIVLKMWSQNFEKMPNVALNELLKKCFFKANFSLI